MVQTNLRPLSVGGHHSLHVPWLCQKDSGEAVTFAPKASKGRKKMGRTRISMVFAALVIVAAAVAGGWLALNNGGSPEPAAAGEKKVIYMSAVEWKGNTDYAKEPYPGDVIPPVGGYKNNPDTGPGRWGTQTYRWDTGSIVVNRGDEVELRIWGVNGANHPTTIEEFVPAPGFNVQRGQLTVVNFTADKAGTFKMTCHTHTPSMESLITVLPFREGK